MTPHKHLITELTRKHLPGYDPRLIAAQIEAESNFVRDARSPVGAMGLMQIMPATWRECCLTLDIRHPDPDNAADNINVGCYYQARMYAGWTAPRPHIDRIALALASYNAGFGHLLEAQRKAGGANAYYKIIDKLPAVTGHHASETRTYVERIFNYYNQYVLGGW